jgi:hypothetical protein
MHTNTHARTHTCTHTPARRRCRSPSRQPSALGQGAPPHWASILRLPTSAQGLGSPPPTSALGVNASTTVHLHRDWAHPRPHLHRDCADAATVHLHRDCAAALDPSLRSCPAHICTGTWAPTAHVGTGTAPPPLPTPALGLGSPPAANSFSPLHRDCPNCAHLRPDCVAALEACGCATFAPGLGASTAHVCTETGRRHCSRLHRDWAPALLTSALGLRAPTSQICPGTHCDWVTPCTMTWRIRLHCTGTGLAVVQASR